jgi:hypothetical protein
MDLLLRSQNPSIYYTLNTISLPTKGKANKKNIAKTQRPKNLAKILKVGREYISVGLRLRALLNMKTCIDFIFKKLCGTQQTLPIGYHGKKL